MRTIASPMPEPRYSNPATRSGLVDDNASFARGVLAPKSSAANSALEMPGFPLMASRINDHLVRRLVEAVQKLGIVGR